MIQGGLFGLLVVWVQQITRIKLSLHYDTFAAVVAFKHHHAFHSSCSCGQLQLKHVGLTVATSA